MFSCSGAILEGTSTGWTLEGLFQVIVLICSCGIHFFRCVYTVLTKGIDEILECAKTKSVDQSGCKQATVEPDNPNHFF